MIHFNETFKKFSFSTYTCEIYIAGSIEHAKLFLQKEFAYEGMCASVEKVDFIYSGGCETGMVVRLIQYPLYITHESNIKKYAIELAQKLVEYLGQGSATVIDPKETVTITRRKSDFNDT